MADKIGIGSDVRKLRLGESFMRNGQTSFHTLRYDFKPASMDVTKEATVAIGHNSEVTITVPHVEGSGTSQTVFKGSKKQYQKECVLIIDRASGEITLERLSNNIQVKTTRAEGSGRAQHTRPITPVDHSTMRKASPNEKHSPSQKNSSPKSSPYNPSPPQRSSPQHSKKTSTMPSNSQRSNNHTKQPAAFKDVSMPTLTTREPESIAPEVGVLSDSSSGSSSSGSTSGSSDSESENEMETVESTPVPTVPPVPVKQPTPPITKHSSSNYPNMPQFSQLSEDLQLSESGSDSD